MKIKYKKKLGENSYVKLSIKIGEYELNDKITKSEIDKIIDTVNYLIKPHHISEFDEEGLPCEEKKKC